MTSNLPAAFYAGLSGLQLNIPKYQFPPPYQDSSRLIYYASLFNSIEINSSFYKLPLASTVKKWYDSVNDNFRFTFKMWKEITHCKQLEFDPENVKLFFDAVANAGNKRGCLLIQMPPSSGIENLGQLEKLMHCIKKLNTDHWNIAVECRNRSWYQTTTYDMLDFYKVALVLHDIPKSATPYIDHVSNIIYLRFHGPTGNYRDSYPEDFLSEYATYIKDWRDQGKTVYAYFNNTMGDAFNNLSSLNQFVYRSEKSDAGMELK